MLDDLQTVDWFRWGVTDHITLFYDLIDCWSLIP